MHRSARHGRPATGRALKAALLVALAFVANPGSAQELTIAVSRTVLSLPLYVAESQHYFAAEGVAVRTLECMGGQRCIKLIFDGQALLATASELPVMFNSFARSDYAVIASFVSTVSAAGSTWRNVRPCASNVETPSVVRRRYGVSSGPRGNSSWYAKSVTFVDGMGTVPA
jgi:NitT/TauT family transport system substrate-binding protein